MTVTTPPLDLGVSIDARAAFVALLLAVDRVNARGQRTPCQGCPAAWESDAPLADRRAAADACAWCPVLSACTGYADAARERHHVWGGRDRARRLPKGDRMTTGLYASDGPRPPREALPACTSCGATWPACKGVRWLRGRECCTACDGHGTRTEPTDAAS